MHRVSIGLGCALLGVVLACGTSPREQLERMGVPFTVASLMEAAEAGDLHVVRLFLDAGMTAVGSDENRRTVLAAAAQGGSPGVVAALLEAGADPNVGDREMRTPLMLAAAEGHAEAAGLLLARGANPNSLRADGMTVLMHAARGGHLEAARALVEYGVEIDYADQFGNTALLHAAEGSHPGVVALLLDAGADPDRRTRAHGAFALGLAAIRDDAESLAHLIRAGADLERRDLEQEMTALSVAALEGRTAAAELLVEAGADLDARDRQGNTPLITAASGGHLGVARVLLAHGAPPDARGASSTTALMFAALNGHREVVEALLAAGADPALRTEGGYSALSASRHEGHDGILATLEAARDGAPPEGRTWARVARYGDAYRTPQGWTAVDPLSSQDYFWGDCSLLGIDRGESPRTRRALLRDERSRSQILLLRGPLLEWMPRVMDGAGPLDGEAGLSFSEHRVRTADGVELDYLLIERGAPARRHLLAVVDLGPEVFVVDAGGPADGFEPATVEAFLRSLRIGAESVPAAPARSR